MIKSADDAAVWAHRNMRAKNSLTAADAKVVEERFQARLSTIGDGQGSEESWDDLGPAEKPEQLASGERPRPVADQGAVSTGQPDVGARPKTAANARKRARSSSVRALGKTVRLRDKNHRRFVLRQPCLVCGRVPSDPHHLTFTQPRALGRRVSDEFMVPVCRVHHRELHRSSNEAAWWRKLNIDPLPVALRLWQQSRTEGEAAPQLKPAGQDDASPRAPESGDHGAGN